MDLKQESNLQEHLICATCKQPETKCTCDRLDTISTNDSIQNGDSDWRDTEYTIPTTGSGYIEKQEIVHLSGVSLDVPVAEQMEPDPLRGRPYIGGRYKILELIGRGGMGTVYKVHHEALDIIYALKVLNPSAASNINIRRFDQEAKAVGQLHHPNLLSVHDFGVSDDGILYLVMDYIDGIGLDAEIKRLGCIDEKRAIEIFKRFAMGSVTLTAKV